MILSHKSNIVLIYKSKDLRKLQQNLFYKQPECFVNDRIQRKNHGNLRKKRRLPLDFLKCHPCLAASLAVTGRDCVFPPDLQIQMTGRWHIRWDGRFYSLPYTIGASLRAVACLQCHARPSASICSVKRIVFIERTFANLKFSRSNRQSIKKGIA